MIAYQQANYFLPLFNHPPHQIGSFLSEPLNAFFNLALFRFVSKIFEEVSHLFTFEFHWFALDEKLLD
jgi:hypothetical protein